ncbi:MAG: hypothetical protein VW665_02270 [Candidatus Puniceispirillum sp.]
MIRQLVQAATFAMIALGAHQVIAGGMAESGTDAPAHNGSITGSSASGATTNSAANTSSAGASSAAKTGSNASAASASGASTSASATNTPKGNGTNSAGASNAASSQEDQSGAAFVAIEDDPLIVDTSGIMDSDGMGSVQLQWQVSSDGKSWLNLTGAVQQSFTPREAHVGKLLRVQISYVDGQGKLETLISPPSSPVQNVNDKPTGTPKLTGAAREKDTLVVDTSLIADEDGMGAYSVIWQQSTSKNDWKTFTEVNGEVLQLEQRHVGFSYRAIISYVDRHGTREVLATSPSEVVINVDDPVEGQVVLKGKAIEGQTLIADTSTVSDLDGIASMTTGWESSRDGRNWRTLEAVGSGQVALAQPMVGQQIRARVSVVDTFGIETIIYSKPTNAIKNVNNKPAGTIFVRRVGN